MRRDRDVTTRHGTAARAAGTRGWQAACGRRRALAGRDRTVTRPRRRRALYGLGLVRVSPREARTRGIGRGWMGSANVGGSSARAPIGRLRLRPESLPASPGTGPRNAGVLVRRRLQQPACLGARRFRGRGPDFRVFLPCESSLERGSRDPIVQSAWIRCGPSERHLATTNSSIMMVLAS